MGLNYQLVLWNKQKKRYDLLIVIGILLSLVTFAGLTLAFNPNSSLETLIIRSTGSLAILMLHLILMIGPLARLDQRFLPILYNRRHLGVSMFLIAAIHGAFSIIQFHTLGDVNPIVSLFTSNMEYGSLVNFPFQVLGFAGLLVLFLMAATSHDFWLANLGPKAWKALHMMVYLAYFVLILHVVLGALQQERSPAMSIALLVGMITIISLHLVAAFKTAKGDQEITEQTSTDFVYACELEDIPEDRAIVVSAGGERVAIYKYDGKLSAVSNVCKHQFGPLGEGKIIDGCITCPWHGYQYNPKDGRAPAPFKEKLPTYHLKLDGNRVLLNPNAAPEGTAIEPVKISKA